MDDELNPLEAELRRMRPAAVPDELTRRIRRELARPAAARAPAAVHWIWAVTVPAAAALAVWLAPVGMRGLQGRGVAAAAEAALKPVKVENVLVAAQDEGFVTLDDGTPARRARLKFVDSVTWRDPRSNASLTWTVPREEVRVMPVVFQ
jgi:hypothetical protein